jgi:hypothetical protein
MSTGTGYAITLEDLTPEWLTEVLRRQQVLTQGHVVAFETRPTSAFNSQTIYLLPQYSALSAQEILSAPARLLLKCSIPEAWAQRAGAREVAFYELVATLPDHPPVVAHCYDCAYDPASGNSHLLLHDLSATHVVALERDDQLKPGENLPSAIRLAQAIDALARFHAYWWQHPLLGTGIAAIGAWCSDEEHYAAETVRRQRAWDDLLAHESDWLPTQYVALYEQILSNLMPLWHRHTEPKIAQRTNFTLTHGDAYLANMLCPKPGVAGNGVIIDWQSPEAYRGASDLVTICATFWTRAQRAEEDRELNVLRHYHRTLQAHGVRDYHWEDLVLDYQIALIEWLLVPLQDRLDGAGKDYWWPKMQCLAGAYEDWRVTTLLTKQTV